MFRTLGSDLHILDTHPQYARGGYVNFCKNLLKKPKVFKKSADIYNTKTTGKKNMTQAFNLQNFLQTYKTQTYDPTKQHAAAEASMEQRLIEQAEQAVQQSGFLTLTLSEKMAELGIGERAMQQFADTAMNLLTEVVNPISDYLEKYENI